MRISISDFTQVIYVDSINGNDDLGNGSQENPYKTIDKCTNSANVDNTLIYIKEGVYPIPNGLTQTIRTDISITYLAETIDDYDKKVIFDLQHVYQRSPVMTKLNRYIGIIFKRSTAGDARVWDYVNNTATIDLVFENCVFDKGDITPTAFIIFVGNSGSGAKVTTLEYKNCTVTPPSLSGMNGTGVYKGTFTNCAIADSNLTSTAGNLLSATFDSDYRVTNSTGDFGVYKGDNAWRVILNKLFIFKDEKYYYYNGSSWSFIEGEITEEKLTLYGMTEVNSSQISQFESLYGTVWSPIRWTDGSPTATGNLFATPTPKILTAKNSIQLTGAETGVFSWSATGDARVSLSVDDGVSYHAFRNGIWNDVTNDMSNAMTASEYTALTWEQYKLLAEDSNFLKHQYYIPNNSTVDDISIIVQLMGENVIADTSSYTINYDEITKTIKYTINKSGSYMVNVVDITTL